MYTKEQILAAINKALADKGKRKFTQSVELAMNFRGINFDKAENRISLDVTLPKGRGKETKVVVFADGPMASEAKAAGADTVLSGAEISKLATEPGKLKVMAKNSEFFAQPQLMMLIGKSFGQILGGRGKLPKPLIGNVAVMLRGVRNVAHLKTRGKNLPTVHCAVGSETMSAEDIAENVNAILSAVVAKVGDYAVSSAYVKLSMGTSQRIE